MNVSTLYALHTLELCEADQIDPRSAYQQLRTFECQIGSRCVDLWSTLQRYLVDLRVRPQLSPTCSKLDSSLVVSMRARKGLRGEVAKIVSPLSNSKTASKRISRASVALFFSTNRDRRT